MSIFWGKLKQDKQDGTVTSRLSLVDHCLDVASVFRELCEIPSTFRSLNLCAGTELNPQKLDRLAVFALFHDLGKCNWAFQEKQNPKAKRTASHIKETIPLFFEQSIAEKFASIFNFDHLIDWVDSPKSLFRVLLASISHHGRPAFTLEEASGIDSLSMAKLWKPEKNIDPMVGLRELFDIAREAFPSAFCRSGEQIPVTVALQHRFAGLVMLADWLGSHSEAFFPFKHTGNRSGWARTQARKALISVGLDPRPSASLLTSRFPSFSNIFGFPPYPLQTRLSQSTLPSLLIAESDTGSGKTEAALIHFLSLFSSGKVDSLYFALPTRVASRELYQRVLKTMKKVFGELCPPVLLAVPGYVKLDGESPYYLPPEDRLYSEYDQLRHERQWSAESPKRFLAASVAVGTIDQALLSTIKVPHAHLRRICLDRALLVIDEVHSSDVYMRALTRKVLVEHMRVGGRALLLSATLGSAAKAEYLNPEGHVPYVDYELAEKEVYPCLNACGHPIEDLSSSISSPKAVKIDPVAALEIPETLLPRVESEISAGKRVMIVLNTVKRAISLFRLASENPNLKRGSSD